MITKCRILHIDSGFAYLMLKEKGYKVTFRLSAELTLNDTALDPRIEVVYKGQVVTPKGLKKPKTHLKIQGKKHPIKSLIERWRADKDYKPTPKTLAEHVLYYGMEAFSRADLTDFKRAIAGYKAEGHPVHRLVARADGELTYLTARTILRCTDMRGDPDIGGVKPKFTPDGHLATLF